MIPINPVRFGATTITDPLHEKDPSNTGGELYRSYLLLKKAGVQDAFVALNHTPTKTEFANGDQGIGFALPDVSGRFRQSLSSAIFY